MGKLDRDLVWEGNYVKLLGITLDNDLKFDKHVSNTCSKANRKLKDQTFKVLNRDNGDRVTTNS